MCAGPGLVSGLAGWAAGTVTAEELQATFAGATLFVQRVSSPETGPAVAAFGPPGAGLVAMYSSLATLAASAGECDWASAPGLDLLALVPDGYGVVVDPAGPHPAVLAAGAIRRGVVISSGRS